MDTLADIWNNLFSFLGLEDPTVPQMVLVVLGLLGAIFFIRRILGLGGSSSPTYHAPTFQAPMYPPNYPPQYPQQGPAYYEPSSGGRRKSRELVSDDWMYPEMEPTPRQRTRQTPQVEPTRGWQGGFKPLGFGLRVMSHPGNLDMDKARALFVPGNRPGITLDWEKARRMFVGGRR